MTDPALPVLPTLGVGSYAAPGWYIAMRRQARRGELGAHDEQELVEDATRIVIGDQIEAGVDVLTDGELSRQRFVYEVFDRLAGLSRRPPLRRLGIAGYDMAPSFQAEGAIRAPEGLGIIEEFERLTRLAPTHAKKIALPGPFTFMQSIDAGSRAPDAVLDELCDVIRSELDGLVAAGAGYIQVDEPGLTRLPAERLRGEAAPRLNRLLGGLSARRCLHVCFGNNAGRPMADRRLQPLQALLAAIDCEELMLEFANRGMIELELAGELAKHATIAAGVIDVKNFWPEPASEVARRIEACLV
ncbi:MAG: methionine synthase, partial [Myxococcales bacterium]|nr:methionine synthase [Myxococcales bacterium]